MRNLLSWFFLIIFFASCFSYVVLVSGQCQSDQQSLLLQLKNSLVFSSTSSVKLAQWDQNTDCCNWSGVDCDEAGHVINLNLSNESISDGIENAAGLFALQHLNSLNLAYNRFNATQIPSRLANLTNLIYLNLSNAGFAGQVPSSISGMTKLVTLDLSSLTFLGSSVLKLENPNLSTFLQNFTEIRELYLDGVNISAHGNEWCKALSSSLHNLQVLSLSNCFLSGPISTSLADLRSLAVVRLDQNNLSSTVPGFLAEFMNLTSLRLSYCGLLGTFPEKFFQVPTLENLDLSNNELLQGSLPQFPQNLSLRTLMLSSTSFSGTLPDSVGNLKNLSRIGLSNCNFTGQIPTAMATLTQIVYLDLSFNNFSGPIPSFHMSKNLTYLDLSNNLLTDAIPSSWEQLQNLSYVDLRFNSLNGSIPSSLFAIPSLQKLQLANNQFRGQVPQFSDASSYQLDTLVLSDNRLEGPIPMSIFELKKLNILLLSSNNFTGTVPLDKIQSLTNLTRLDFSYNSLTVNASSNGSFLPQITTLRLASCNLNVIPNLKNQSRLFQLDLSDNQISGEIPNWIWEVGNGDLNSLNLSHNFLVGLQEPYVIPNLSVLDLHSNFLRGKIPLPPPDVIYVDYSKNSFSSIPTEIGNSLTFTMFFSLSDNMISGPIPESICNATLLQVLDLSNNSFNCNIPKCLTQSSETLGVLNLRRNNLTGIIFDTFPETCALQTVDLSGNHLQGMVPKSLANCTMLEVLDLGSNQINDTFPCWLKNISSLCVLVLRSNRFYGNISCQDINGAWPKLQIVDLAINNFNGTIPGKYLTTWKAMMADEDEAQSQFKHLQFQFLEFGQLYYQDSVTVTSKGLELELVKILTLFTSIDLSNNNFEGPIPEETGLLKSLRLLNLSHNALTGPIPLSMGNLLQLESLDLSANELNISRGK
ncbi:receptor-like protein 6 [Pistacia vera]|uniref:receptor-like protein 6 n=1 Tax=Pistacia vera TaxID=55513 RepID=UPI00126337F7|nr:receptor-like protein 6 [Pistacia vera]